MEACHFGNTVIHDRTAEIRADTEDGKGMSLFVQPARLCKRSGMVIDTVGDEQQFSLSDTLQVEQFACHLQCRRGGTAVRGNNIRTQCRDQIANSCRVFGKRRDNMRFARKNNQTVTAFAGSLENVADFKARPFEARGRQVPRIH